MTVPGDLAAALAGRYVIERQLARGGMATVYLAREPRHDRRVAIKVLQPEYTPSLGADRFLREIRIVAGLAHPYIVPLLDSGEADGCLFLVTPFAPDGSLRDRIGAEQRLGVDQAVHIARDVGEALDFAHAQGILHRDVKPDNILFASGHALLADFGIARTMDVLARGPTTTAGLTLGTPEYMSPEQAAGDDGLGPTSDVYSLACVIYETLAGGPPLRGENARTTLAKQVTETPLPIRFHRPDAPPAVEFALQTALAKDPGHRFETRVRSSPHWRGLGHIDAWHRQPRLTLCSARSPSCRSRIPAATPRTST